MPLCSLNQFCILSSHCSLDNLCCSYTLKNQKKVWVYKLTRGSASGIHQNFNSHNSNVQSIWNSKFWYILKNLFYKENIKKKSFRKIRYIQKKLHQNLPDTSKMKTVIIDNALDVRVSSIFIKHQFSKITLLNWSTNSNAHCSAISSNALK